MLSIKNIKYNIGERVRAKINYQNNSRKEVEATIIGIILDDEYGLRYKIHIPPEDFEREMGCEGDIGYVSDDQILEKRGVGLYNTYDYFREDE